MKVLKFGGTSVGTVDSLKNVKAIVEAIDCDTIVVVSALGGITDKLIATARQAAEGDISHLSSLAEIVGRHLEVIDGMIPAERRRPVIETVNGLLDELANIYRGVSLIGDLSPRTLDIIVAYGERLSSLIVSHIIDGAVLFDSREFIKTVSQFDKEVLDPELTGRLIAETFASKPFKTAVVPGFIATSADNGRITNLGRGGSDYTAAIIAATLDAEALEIWTDVDGFMTADPRVINKTYVIDHLTFIEAMELCNFGAKVVYPPTIYPVFHKGIPIYIKNTFNPAAPGTLINNTPDPSPDDKIIKGISSINDTSLVTVSGLGMVGVSGINARIFSALARGGVSVFMVAQASSENNTSIAVKNCDAPLCVSVLNAEFAPEIAAGVINEITARSDLATVAVVGENMRHTPRIAGRLFNTLGRNGISVIACAQGASETNISFVIELRHLRKALNVIHDAFFLSETRVLNLFIVGIGNVGRPLLRQIAAQQSILMRDKALRLQVVGIANSRKCVFDRDGLDISDPDALLEASTLKATPERIRDEVIAMNIYNPVFVDCTSSPQIAGLYLDLLAHNVNVVAANKIAAASSFDNYAALKAMARRKGVKYLFETNVGAGLPIINTINSLINSGDRIVSIKAVLSGSLNYIFNVLSPDVPFSRAVGMAVEAGYAEPDPRVDLSGVDVARKIVILAREAGYRIDIDDIDISPLLPADVADAPLDTFAARLTGLDAEWEKRRSEAERAGRHFRYVATLADGKISVALVDVPAGHPFHDLEGSNNVILITTERYREFPIAIKGYGAGAEVTAAGVFADIISIANIR